MGKDLAIRWWAHYEPDELNLVILYLIKGLGGGRN